MGYPMSEIDRLRSRCDWLESRNTWLEARNQQLVSEVERLELRDEARRAAGVAARYRGFDER